jgi:phage terminase large subunit GpA-like protein
VIQKAHGQQLVPGLVLPPNTSDATALVLSAYAQGFEPPPVLAVSEWAEGSESEGREPGRILTKRESPEPGPWRNDRTPYLVEIMDALSIRSPVERVVFMKGAQIGGSEVGNNWIGYILAHAAAAAPTMMVVPTVEMAKRTSKQRLDPLISNSPAIRDSVKPKKSREGGNTLLLKEFAGGDGILALTGANSAQGLRQFSARNLFVDEPDAYPVEVDGEGDPMDLLETRSSAFGRKAKTYVCCTPTVKGGSRIEEMWEETDQRYYHVPCPECGVLDKITWGRIDWKKNEAGQHLPRTAFLRCDSCGAEIPESKKSWMLERGQWIADHPDRNPRVRGYHLSALYSPLGWKSWEKCVEQFLKAKRHRDKQEKMKVWTNVVLGQSYEARGEGLDWEKIQRRRENFPEGAEIPLGALCCVAGVDVQDDRLEATAVAFGEGEESWVIEHAIFQGDPELPAVWAQLDEWLQESYTHESGNPMSIACCAIDSGYKTRVVYDFARTRSTRRIYAVKGIDGEGRPLVARPRKEKTGRDPRPVQLFLVGADTAKGQLYSRLRETQRGPGYIHVPEAPWADDEWFKQLCAETRKTQYRKGRPVRVWLKNRTRNEALDCMVYALAALQLLNPQWGALSRIYGKKKGERKREEPKGLQLPPSMRQKKKRGWVDRWKD